MKSAIVFLFLACAVASYGKDKHAKKQDDSSLHHIAQDQITQDQITVVAHIPSTGGPVTRFITTEHYGRSYVYAEHATGKTLTLIDVTHAGQPEVLADMAYPDGTASASVLSATGTVALVSDAPAAEEPARPSQTIRIMNLSDPQHPAVAQEFKGITATATRPGLIFLANADGIWILQQHFGEDPEVAKSYRDKVIYGESMFH